MVKQEQLTYTRELSKSRVHLLVTGGDGLTDVCIVPGEQGERGRGGVRRQELCLKDKNLQ